MSDIKLNEARKLLDDLRDEPAPLIEDVLEATGLLAEAMSDLPKWVWDNANHCCPPGESCCNCR